MVNPALSCKHLVVNSDVLVDELLAETTIYVVLVIRGGMASFLFKERPGILENCSKARI